MHVNQKMWNNMWHPARHLWFFFGAIYLHCSPGISLARRQLARLGSQPGNAYLWLIYEATQHQPALSHFSSQLG